MNACIINNMIGPVICHRIIVVWTVYNYVCFSCLSCSVCVVRLPMYGFMVVWLLLTGYIIHSGIELGAVICGLWRDLLSDWLLKLSEEREYHCHPTTHQCLFAFLSQQSSSIDVLVITLFILMKVIFEKTILCLPRTNLRLKYLKQNDYVALCLYSVFQCSS